MKLKLKNIDNYSKSLDIFDAMNDLCNTFEFGGRKPTRIRLSSALFGLWRGNRHLAVAPMIYHVGDRFQGSVEVIEDPSLPADEMIAEDKVS